MSQLCAPLGKVRCLVDALDETVGSILVQFLWKAAIVTIVTAVSTIFVRSNAGRLLSSPYCLKKTFVPSASHSRYVIPGISCTKVRDDLRDKILVTPNLS